MIEKGSVETQRSPAIDNTGELAAAAGVCSSAIAALLLSRTFAPGGAQKLAKPLSGYATDVTARWARGFLLGQFITYLLCIAAVAVAAFVWFVVWRFVVARTSPATGARLSAAAAAAVILWAALISPLLGLLVAGTLLVATWLTASAATPRSALTQSASATAGRMVLLAEALASTWGLWLVLGPAGWGFVVPIVLAIAVVAAALSMARLGTGAGLTRAIVAGTPMLLLPLLGLWRGPSVAWFVAAALAALALAIFGRPPIFSHRARPLLQVLALFSLSAIAIIPLRMPEAGSINTASHEAQHLGWVNSALHGRWLGADSGTLYGILREYLITGYCYVFGATVEHVRIAHLALNLIGVLVFLFTARALFSHRPLLMVSLCYLALFYTPFRNFCDYDKRISLGWADGLRMFAATGVVVMACVVLAKDGESPAARSRHRLLLLCGVLTALTLLYSQEYGLCAAGAILVSVVASHVFQHRTLSVGERARLAAISLGSIAAGIAAPIVVVLGIYATSGKARLLVSTTWKTLSLTASGAFGSLEFPVTAKTYAHPEELFLALLGPDNELRDPTIQFIVPVAIYLVAICSLIVRAVNCRWCSRSTILFGLVALGVSSFRVTLARASIDHLTSPSAPSIFCVGILLDEALDASIHLYEGVKLPLGIILAAGLSLLTIVVTERITGIGRQFEQIANGQKSPLPKTPFRYPDLPRAGDAHLEPDFQAIARFVREVTRPEDTIFTMLYMMDGGELYFLCDRANPTRYDLLAEIMTAEQQREVLQSLQANPPRLIIGEDASIVGEQVAAYVRDHWPVKKTIGRYTVLLPAP